MRNGAGGLTGNGIGRIQIGERLASILITANEELNGDEPTLSATESQTVAAKKLLNRPAVNRYRGKRYSKAVTGRAESVKSL